MTDHADQSEVSRRLRDAVIRAGDHGLPVGEVLDFTTLVYVGESAVAFEDLCTQLYEHEIVLPLPEIEELESLGRLLNVDDEYARMLREITASQ